MEPHFQLIEDDEFFSDVASDALGSTKRCRRLTNYVYPQKCKKMLFYGKTVVKLLLTFRVIQFGLLKLSLIVNTPVHVLF